MNITEHIKSYIHGAFGHAHLWFVLIILSIFSIYDIPASNAFNFNTFETIAYLLTVGTFKATIILLIIYPALRRARLRAIAWIIVFLYGLLSIINIVSTVNYGFGICRKLILITAETNLNEIKEFIPGLLNNIKTWLLNPCFWIAVTATVLLYVLAGKLPRKILAYIAIISVPAGILSIMLFTYKFETGKTLNFMSFRIPKYIVETYRTQNELAELIAKNPSFPSPESVESKKSAHNIIVVIGESASMEHHSIYGYGLPTTPCLDTMKDSLIIFTDAISSSMNTHGNMERLLTFKEDDRTYGDWYEYPLITHLFKAAGYKTFWLSNQERTGLFSNASGAIASTADVTKYVGKENSEDVLSSRYDEALIPEVNKAICDTASYKIIFSHLMGSHTKYRFRYPENFNHFSCKEEMTIHSQPWITTTEAETIAAYDNSIRYTDYLLGKLINSVSKLQEPTLLIYFSDHGECVYDDENFIGRKSRYARVPFIIYPNAAYRDQNTQLTEKMKSTCSNPFSTANTIYMLMTMSGTTHPCYNPQKDILSDEFISQPRYIDEVVWEYEKSTGQDELESGRMPAKP